MTWRRYAAGVAISAGVFVTGIMWWQRPSPYDAGEDIAALAADVWERNAVFFAGTSGDPAAAFVTEAWWAGRGLRYSNAVSVARARELIEQMSYDIKRHLVPARAGIGVGDVFSPGAVHWLQDDAAFDSVIAEYPPVAWTNEVSVSGGGYETRKWTFAQTRDTVIPHILTLDTRDADPARCYDFSPDYAVYVPGASELYGGLEAAGGVVPNSWWEGAGFGTNLFVWPRFERIDTNGAVGYAHHQITTNILNSLRAVVTNMRQAVLISSEGNAAYWRCGSNSHTASVMHITENDWWPNPFDTTNVAPPTAFFTANKEAGLVKMGALNAPNNFSSFVAPPVTLAQMYYRWTAHRSFTRSRRNSVNYDRHTASAAFHAGGSRKYLDEVFCLWPPQWVYESNLVSRVRYYGVFGLSAAPPYGPVYPIYNGRHLFESISGTNASWEATPATYALAAPEVDPFCGYAMSYGITNYPQTMTATIDGHDEIGSFRTVPEVWRPVLLADESDPSAAPKVSIGPESVSFETLEQMLIATGFNSEFEDYKKGNYDYSEEEVENHLWHRSLGLWALICVVDFNFTDYASGGKGDPYTPPWATNAPAYTP